MTAADGGHVGSLGEEATKLLQALQGWARESGGEYADATAAAAQHAASAASRVSEHIATGGRDCTYCPVCRAISAVRDTSPEVREHLSAAATSLLRAAASMMATRVPDPSTSNAASPVQRIDLGDEADDRDDADADLGDGPGGYYEWEDE